MQTLDDIKKEFTTKTDCDYNVELLAYKPGQKFPIIGIMDNYDYEDWHPIAFDTKGRNGVINGSVHHLVPIKKHLPKDTLCEVWMDTTPHNKVLRYADGTGQFFYNGVSSVVKKTLIRSTTWDNYEVVENPPIPWFGQDDEGPDLEGLTYEIFYKYKWHNGNRRAWSWICVENPTHDITAYRITGEKK